MKHFNVLHNSGFACNCDDEQLSEQAFSAMTGKTTSQSGPHEEDELDEDESQPTVNQKELAIQSMLVIHRTKPKHDGTKQR